MTPTLLILFIGLVLSSVCQAQDTKYSATPQQLSPPGCLIVRDLYAGECASDEHEAWLADLHHWRDERRIRIGYDGFRYELPALHWTQSSFIQSLLMIEDRYFYDPVTHRYTVDRYVDDLVRRYGGIDAVLIWPTYSNIGIDNRNQHDLIRSMPGGVEGVKQMVADFHRRGVRVLFPMMMWDQGTRNPGTPWPKAIAELMKELNADGINGDTEQGVARAFPEAADKIGYPLAFEPEDNASDEAVAYNLLTWGQYDYPFAPQVDRSKWLEPRHMVNVSDRWSRNKTDNLQFAFFMAWAGRVGRTSGEYGMA
jgi:iron(II)-dependent oxidoreductase